MDILVDFDNIERQTRDRGVSWVCTKILQAIAKSRGDVPARCRIRLYGGWYDNDVLSKIAQALVPSIQSEFPSAIRWNGRGKIGDCLTEVEMACSLAAEPGRTLTHTIRTVPFEEKVRCQTDLLGRCGQSPCPMKPIGDFFRTKRCPSGRCYMTPGDLLEKETQKLVDTMLVADLIFYATRDRGELVVVSSDDDMWPGIQSALFLGARVLHLHTHPNFRTRPSYSQGLQNYRETTL